MLIKEQPPYFNTKKVAQGGFGQIYQGQTTFHQKIIIKTWNIPNSSYDRNVLFDIFNEISILDFFRNQKYITNLIEFGAANSDYYVVLTKYPMTLK